MSEPQIIKIPESTRESIIKKYHLHETSPAGHWMLWSDHSTADRSIHVVVPPKEALKDALTMAEIEDAPTIYVHVLANYTNTARPRLWGLPPMRLGHYINPKQAH